MAFSHQDRIDAGVSFDWSSLPAHRTSLDDLPRDSTELRFRRDGSSHKGIHRFSSLRRVWLYSVNQDFLEELADIPTIERLFIDGTTATDLTPLHRLRQLRRLVINGGEDSEHGLGNWAVPLGGARHRELQARASSRPPRVAHQPHCTRHRGEHLDADAHGHARTAVKSPRPSLPIPYQSDSVRPQPSPLTFSDGFGGLQIGALFPDEELLRLRQALPRLRCDWFEMIDRHGSTREGLRAAVHGAR